MRYRAFSFAGSLIIAAFAAVRDERVFGVKMKTKFNKAALNAYAVKKATAFVRAASLAAVAELKDIEDPNGQEIVITQPVQTGDTISASVGIRSPYAVISELGSEKRKPKPYVSKLATDPTRRARIVAKAAVSLKI
jgi:hypothetical protein